MSARVTPPGLSNERPRYLEATHDCDPRRSKGSAVVRVGRSLSRATSARVWKKALQRRSAQRFLFKLRTTLTHIKSKRGEPNIDQTLPVWGGRPRPPPCECTAQTLAQDPVELIFVADGVQPFVRYRPALEVSGKFLRTPGTAVKQHHSGRNCRNRPRRCYRIFAA